VWLPCTSPYPSWGPRGRLGVALWGRSGGLGASKYLLWGGGLGPPRLLDGSRCSLSVAPAQIENSRGGLLCSSCRVTPNKPAYAPMASERRAIVRRHAVPLCSLALGIEASIYYGHATRVDAIVRVTRGAAARHNQRETDYAAIHDLAGSRHVLQGVGTREEALKETVMRRRYRGDQGLAYCIWSNPGLNLAEAI